jgi:hypothetical protein
MCTLFSSLFKSLNKYTRASLKVNILKDLTGISQSGFHQLWLQIQHKKIRSFLLCVTYRPPDSPVSHFVDEFTDAYAKPSLMVKWCWLYGDLNCDLLKCSSESDAFYNLCSILNLSQLVTLPTRVTPTTSSQIDVTMTSNTAIIKETRVVETHVSDHYLIDTCVNTKLPKPPVIYTTSRSYKKYQPKHLGNDLVQFPGKTPYVQVMLMTKSINLIASFSQFWINTHH